MKGARALSSSSNADIRESIHFPDDFDRLASSWSSLSTNYRASPTTSVLRHIIDCAAVLRDLNQDRGRPADGEGVLTSAICNSSYNTLTTSLERILLESMTCQLPPESPAEASNILELGCSILRQFPDAAKLEKTGSSQKTLLHRVAIKPACGVQSVKSVFSYCRKSIEMTDAMGALPLHHATHASPPDVDIVRTLLDLNPAAATVPDRAGYLPLHWAVNSTNAKAEIVRLLLKANPEGAMKPCRGGSLPLHWSVDRDKPMIGIVQELTNVYRGGLSKACSLGWLPIHRCVDRADPKMSVLKWLINHHPNGLRVANCDGQLPLHRLVDRSAPSLNAIQLVATAYPEALLVADAEGYLPLHLALDGDNPSARVVGALIHMCPESAAVTTIDGLLPLHCALNCCLTAIVPREIILTLLQAFPAGALQEAVDMVPLDPEANADDWDGPWRQVKWTPMSRAEELADDELIEDIRLAILNPAPPKQFDHVGIGMPVVLRRNSSDCLETSSVSSVNTGSYEERATCMARSGPGSSSGIHDRYSESEDPNASLLSDPLSVPLSNNPMINIDSLSFNSNNSINSIHSLKASTPHSWSAGNLLAGLREQGPGAAPETGSPGSGSPFDRSRKRLGSAGRKRTSPELAAAPAAAAAGQFTRSADNTPRLDALPALGQGQGQGQQGAARIPALHLSETPAKASTAPGGSVYYNGIFSSHVVVEPPTPNRELAIDVMGSPPASARDDASTFSLMSRGSMDSSQLSVYSAGSSRRGGGGAGSGCSGVWVRSGDADSVSSSTDGGNTFFRRKSNRRGTHSGSKYGPGDTNTSILHDFGAILEQDDEQTPRSGRKSPDKPHGGHPTHSTRPSPTMDEKKHRSMRSKRKHQQEAEKITNIISQEKPIAVPSKSVLLNMV
jgi:ankyrin repeat protein